MVVASFLMFLVVNEFSAFVIVFVSYYRLSYSFKISTTVSYCCPGLISKLVTDFSATSSSLVFIAEFLSQ